MPPEQDARNSPDRSVAGKDEQQLLNASLKNISNFLKDKVNLEDYLDLESINKYASSRRAMLQLSEMIRDYDKLPQPQTLVKALLIGTLAMMETPYQPVIIQDEPLQLTMFFLDIFLNEDGDNDKPTHLTSFFEYYLDFIRAIKKIGNKKIVLRDFFNYMQWHLLLFGSSSTKEVLEKTKSKLESEDLPIDEVLGYVVLPHMNEVGEEYKSFSYTMLKKVLTFKSLNCDLVVLRNFILDLPDIIKLLKNGKAKVKKAIDDKNSDILLCYASLISDAIEIEIEKKFRNSNITVCKNLVESVLTNRHRLKEFTSLIGVSKNPKKLFSSLRILHKKCEISSAKSKQHKWLEENRGHAEIGASREDVQQWLGKYHRPADDVTSVSREQLFIKLGKKLINQQTKRSTVEWNSEYMLTAFSMAHFLLGPFKPYRGRGLYRVCIVTSSNQDLTEIIEKFQDTEIPVLKFDEEPTITGNRREIRYGCLGEMTEYMEKVKGKPYMKYFGILVDFEIVSNADNANQQQHKLVGLTPLMLMAWMCTKSNNLAKQSKRELFKFFGEQLESIVQTTNISYLFPTTEQQESMWKKHLHEFGTRISLLPSNTFDATGFNSRMQSKRCAEEMKNRFGESWIHMKEPGVSPQKRAPSVCEISSKFEGDYDHRIFMTYRGLKKQASLFFQEEEEWIKAIKNEIRVNKRTAIVITANTQMIEKLRRFIQQDTSRITIANDVIEDGKRITVQSGQLLFLDVSRCVTVVPKANAEVHFISCSFPKSMQEHLRLIGQTVCYDVVHSQRYILCKSDFSVDIDIYISNAFKMHYKKANWEDPSHVDFDIPDIVGNYLQNHDFLEDVCWPLYKAASHKVQNMNWKNANDEDTIFKELYESGDQKDSRKWRAAIQNELRIWGTPYYYGDSNRIHPRGKEFAAEKHFANVQTFDDILVKAMLAYKNRDEDKEHGHTIIHFKCDPDKYDDWTGDRDKIADRETGVRPKTTFYSRVAFEVHFDRKDDYINITIIKGDFEFFYPDVNSNKTRLPYLLHYNRLLDDGMKAVIYKQLNPEDSVIPSLKALLSSPDNLQHIVHHHDQVKETCAPGDIYTYPVNQISDTNNNQRLRVKNVSASHPQNVQIQLKEGDQEGTLRKNQLGPGKTESFDLGHIDPSYKEVVVKWQDPSLGQEGKWREKKLPIV